MEISTFTTYPQENMDKVTDGSYPGEENKTLNTDRQQSQCLKIS